MHSAHPLSGVGGRGYQGMGRVNEKTLPLNRATGPARRTGSEGMGMQDRPASCSQSLPVVLKVVSRQMGTNQTHHQQAGKTRNLVAATHFHLLPTSFKHEWL